MSNEAKATPEVSSEEEGQEANADPTEATRQLHLQERYGFVAVVEPLTPTLGAPPERRTSALLTLSAMETKPCPDCGTTDARLHYKSGKMSRCYDCQHYVNLTRKATGGGVEFTRDQFVNWKRESDDRRLCVYCGIDGEQLYALNVVNPRTKKRLEVIGVDRRDNATPYRLDNLDPCCPLCNQIKSQLLTTEEMHLLGPHLRKVWAARLARAVTPPDGMLVDAN